MKSRLLNLSPLYLFLFWQPGLTAENSPPKTQADIAEREEKGVRRLDEVGRYGVHKAIVTGLAFSPDGKHVLSVSDDQKVRYWKFETGDTVHTFDGGGGMRTCAISPDGRLAASAGFRSAILLWDLTSGENAGSLDARSDQFLAVRFSNTGRFLLSKSRNGKVHVWNLDTKKIIYQFDASVRYGYGLAVSPADSSGEEKRIDRVHRIANRLVMDTDLKNGNTEPQRAQICDRLTGSVVSAPCI